MVGREEGGKEGVKGGEVGERGREGEEEREEEREGGGNPRKLFTISKGGARRTALGSNVTCSLC